MSRLTDFSAAAALALAVVAAPVEAQAPSADTCKTDPKFRAQDFTVGTWDVYNGDRKTAEVKMALILNDCVIQETWTVPAGRTGNGTGLFNYSPLLKDWGYYWATDNGSSTSFRGSLIKPGEIRYVTERPLGDGKVRLRHWTLSAMPDGTVRELSMGTEDKGETWTTEYDLKWVRQK
jgi:hypothetical protein